MEIIVKEKPNIFKPNEISFTKRQKQLDEKELKEQERVHRSPFTKFYQINKETSKYLQNITDENPKALKILFFIFEHMDKYNAVVCSYKVLQEALNISPATITRAIKYLKDKSFIYVYKSGTANIYIANPNLVWNSWGSNTKYCEFPANVILSANEQEERDKVFDKEIKAVYLKESNKGEADEETETKSNTD